MRNRNKETPSLARDGMGGGLPCEQTFAVFKSSADCRTTVTFPPSINSC